MAANSGTTRVLEAGLFDYLAILWRRKWIVVLTVVVAVGIAVGIDQLRTPLYSATSSIQFLNQSTSANTTGVNYFTPTAISTDVQLVTGQQVRAKASEILGRPAPPVTVTQIGTTAVADLSVTSPDAAFAAEAANAYAKAYEAVTRENYLYGEAVSQASLDKQIAKLQTEITSVTNQLALSGGSTTGGAGSSLSSEAVALAAQKDNLESQLAAIQLAAAQSANGATTVSLARPSDSPTSPKYVRDALYALGAGLVAGIGLAFIWDYRDDRIRSRQDLEQAIGGLPAIGIIPLVSDWRDRKVPYLITADRPKSPTAEAYRALRTSLRFMSLESPIATLVVTSPAAADGKTTTSANLAVIMAQAGQRVVLVGCDLRRPRIHDFFGVSNDVGFTTVLLGEAELEDALVPTPGQENLQVLPSGPVPPNPSELLASAETSRVLRQLIELTDVVILDSPPILPVTDAAVLAAQSDGVLLVTSAGISTIRDTSRSLEILLRVEAPVVGAVLNRAPETDAYAYYRYGYGYGAYGYASLEPDLPAASAGAAEITASSNGSTGSGSSETNGTGPGHARRRRLRS